MDDRQHLINAYQLIRSKTEELCTPLNLEMYVIQAHPDVSPPKWHLAHTTWFFETFILKTMPHYKIFNPLYHYLFNSYYKTQGNAFPREQRGLLAKPSVDETYEYRKYVDQAILMYLESDTANIDNIIKLGLHHEQQHQELLLMDLKYNYHIDPSFPTYTVKFDQITQSQTQLRFLEQQGGLVEIGASENLFCFDNELPRHSYFLKPFAIANRLVTNEEFLEFILAGSYSKPELWLDDGWAYLQNNQVKAPLYWKEVDKQWYEFTLSGLNPLVLSAPVGHISYYEADAYARFRKSRLPTEFEWESCAEKMAAPDGNFLDNQLFHPTCANTQNSEKISQLLGDLWEWTSSAYLPYPGFKALPGSLGEYNGKFMNNQMVLRGGSCITPKDHVRISYRNFFQPEKRWQFSGIRLCKDID